MNGSLRRSSGLTQTDWINPHGLITMSRHSAHKVETDLKIGEYERRRSHALEAINRRAFDRRVFWRAWRRRTLRGASFGIAAAWVLFMLMLWATS